MAERERKKKSRRVRRESGGREVAGREVDADRGRKKQLAGEGKKVEG